jgi:hypothetical protein
MDCLSLTWLELNAMDWIALGNPYKMIGYDEIRFL